MPTNTSDASAALASSAARRRVFLVEDHSLVRECLANLVEDQPDFTVCGQAADDATTRDGIAATQPDLVLMDLSLNGKLAFELIKDIHAMKPTPVVLVVSMHDELFYAQRALSAGARGYVMKRETTGMVIEAMRLVLTGKIYVSAPLAAKLVERIATLPAVAAGKPPESPVSQLSDRELEVFRLIGQGWENRRIAEELHLSMKTVQVYCARIKEKLHLENATELLREAVRWVERDN
jgi:DNA-binding NarL/FixJ family response regulator